MKFNIYIKILIAFIVCFFIFVAIFFYFLKSVENKIVINAAKTTSQGVLITLEKKLINNPKSNWDKIIKNNADNAIYIIPIHNLKLTSKQKDELNNSKIIFQSGATYQFLNLAIVEHTAYKKIGNTSYALAYYFSNPEQFISHYMNPAIKLIVKDLLSKPENTWNEEVSRLEKIYGFPLKVYKNKSNKLPNHIINSLTTRKLVFETNKNTSQIGIIYYAFNGAILKIGPLRYLPITGRITDILYYFILAFFILSLCLILFLSLLFVKNMKRIYQTTENFSHGNFNFRTKIGTTSVLYGLYTNINVMGEKLQQLIESKKNMSRFVAHEIRTPLYTMQLALDSLRKEKHLSESTQKKLVSIQEDIDDINKLINYFLLYYKTTSHELKLKTKVLNIVNWLNNTVKRYELSKTNVTLKQPTQENIMIDFDPNLLKHVVDNLITNALKVAKQNVLVSLAVDRNYVEIHVEDDGPGISEPEMKKLFQPFATINTDRDLDKHIGLGLTIAKSIIELHQGSIVVSQSNQLGGARFIIKLPR